MIITVSNQKGGVGKSTTAHALAAGMADRGKRVLAIDLDPQGNLTFCNAGDQRETTIYDVLKGSATIDSAIIVGGKADIIPSNILLSSADMEFTQTGREFLLRDVLDPIKSRYDYIIIDTPPTLGTLTINAFTAADTVVIPLGADIFSLQGIALLSNTIERVKKYCNPSLKIAGLLLTRYSDRTVLNRDMRDIIKSTATQLGTKVFNTYIRESVSVREAQAQQQDVFSYAPKSNPAVDYNAFIDELFSTHLLLKEGK